MDSDAQYPQRALWGGDVTQALAILLASSRRRRLMAKLRRLAMTRGPLGDARVDW